MTKGAVYSNFAGKTDLILSLLERYTQAEIGQEMCASLRDTDLPRADRCADAGRRYARRLTAEETRMKAMLQVELWLFGMRDFSAGWRIADWYHSHREDLAAGLAPDPDASSTHTADPDHPRSRPAGPDIVHGPCEAGHAPSRTGAIRGIEDLSPRDRAALAMAVEFGLALQHLLDPDRVPAELYGSGMNLILGPALP